MVGSHQVVGAAEPGRLALRKRPFYETLPILQTLSSLNRSVRAGTFGYDCVLPRIAYLDWVSSERLTKIICLTRTNVTEPLLAAAFAKLSPREASVLALRIITI